MAHACSAAASAVRERQALQASAKMEWDVEGIYAQLHTASVNAGLFAAFDGDALLAPVRAPAVVDEGPVGNNAMEAEQWQQALGAHKGQWAGVVAEAEQQWTAVKATTRAWWGAVQRTIRAFFDSFHHIVIIKWDLIDAHAHKVWAALEDKAAQRCAHISRVMRLEGALLSLVVQERWAQAQAAMATADGPEGGEAVWVALGEQRAVRDRAMEAVWGELRAAAAKWRLIILFNLIGLLRNLIDATEPAIQDYEAEWPKLGAATPPQG